MARTAKGKAPARASGPLPTPDSAAQSDSGPQPTPPSTRKVPTKPRAKKAAATPQQEQGDGEDSDPDVQAAKNGASSRANKARKPRKAPAKKAASTLAAPPAQSEDDDSPLPDVIIVNHLPVTEPSDAVQARIAETKKSFNDTRVRLVMPGKEIYKNFPAMCGYINVPDHINLKAYLHPRQPWYIKAIQPWIDVKERANNAPINRGSLFRRFGTTVHEIPKDKSVRDSFDWTLPQDGKKPNSILDITIHAIKVLILESPDGIFWRTEENCPFPLDKAFDFKGNDFIVEDMNRAFQILQCAVQLSKDAAAASKKTNTLRGQSHVAQRPYYLTDNDLHGYTDEDKLEEMSAIADKFSFDFESRQRQLVQDEIANEDMSEEARLKCYKMAEVSFQHGLSELRRYTSKQLPNERRPTFDDKTRASVCTQIASNVTVVYPRSGAEGEAAADATAEGQTGPVFEFDADAARTATIDETEAITAQQQADLPEKQQDNFEFKEPGTQSRKAEMAFKQQLSRAAMTTPGYEEALTLLEWPIPEKPVITDEVKKQGHKAIVEALEPYSNIEFAPGLHLKPHQTIGIATIRTMEQSVIGGAILADDMGLGKTVQCLATVLQGARQAEKTRCNSITGQPGKFKPTLIAAPAASLLAWKADGRKFFSKELVFRYFFGDPDTVPEEERPLTIGMTADDFINEVMKHDPSDPKTERVVILTSIGTWGGRAVKRVSEGMDADPNVQNNEPYRQDEDDVVMEQAVEEGELEHLIKDWVGRIIVDEGHRIKGPKTKGHKSIVEANADSYIIVTGTPLSNKLKDFEGLMRIFWQEYFEQEEDDLETDSEPYRKAFTAMEKAFRGKSIKEKFATANISPFLWTLNPDRYRRIAKERTRAIVGTVDTRIGTDLLPTIFNLLVIARQKASVTEICGHQIACAEIPPSVVQIVELKPLYCQRIQYRNIHLEEASKSHGGPSSLENDSDAVFQATASGRRLVLAAFNTALDCFYVKGVASAKIFTEVLGSDNKSGDLGERASEYYHRMTRPAAWLPAYSQVRLLDLLYQCSLSAKKSWLCGILHDLIYVQLRKVVLFLGWPQSSLDVELLLSTLGITFCTLKSLTYQTHAQREKAIRDFSDPALDIKVLVTSLRVGAESTNLQAASAVVILDYPTSAASFFQAMSRVSRLGQPRDTIVLVAMCHNTVDQQIAASTERKYLPILAGSCDLKAEPHEVEASMRKAKLNVNDPTVAADNYDMHYNIVITEKAQIIYRKMIGSRSSHIPYAEANIDLIDFMPGNRWQNHEAQRVECQERWQSDVALTKAKQTKGLSEAVVMVAENAGLNKEELLLILRNKNSILRALHLGELGPLTKEELASSSKKRTKFSSDLRIKAGGTPLKEQFVRDREQIVTPTPNDDDAPGSSQIDADNADTMQSPTPMPAAGAAASQGKAAPEEDQDSALSDPPSDSELDHIAAEPAPAVRRSIRSKRKHDTDATDESAAPSSKKRQRGGRAKGKGKAKQVFGNDKIVNSDDDAAD